MADSENSMTLAPIAQRGFLSGMAAWLTEQSANMSLELGATASEGTVERVIFLWRDWIATHRKVERLCRTQQRLERRLVAALGFPRVEISADRKQPVAAFTADEIDFLLGGGAENASARREAKAVLRERQQAWDAMDERLGYSRARRAEAEAEAHLDKLAKALWAEPVQSIAGIVAKLHLVLLRYEDEGPRDEPPWPQIRSILTDLTSLNGTRSDLSKSDGVAGATK